GMEGGNIEEIQKMDWYSFLARFKSTSDEEWNKITIAWDKQPNQVHTFSLMTDQNPPQIIQCRTVPILDAEQKVLGRIWIFENPPSEN
ncbi:MAG: hypothetical protein ACP5I1_20875, partial [Candidatus Hinthialibacter sp.]